MTIWQRILRYLILWGVLFLVLCVISVVRYWDELGNILSATISSYLTTIITIAVIGGLLIYAIISLFRFRS
jgi:hypothetical protein